MIDTINEYSEGTVVAVDIVSGVDSTTGKILGTAINADYTATFFAPKLGSAIYPGAEMSGEIVISDIGIPKSLTESSEFNMNLITFRHCSLLLPLRKPDSHKGTYGSVLTVAGAQE